MGSSISILSLLEVRKDLGLMEDGSWHTEFSGLGQCSQISSPISSPIYPPGFEPTAYEPGALVIGQNLDRPMVRNVFSETDRPNVLTDSAHDDTVLADLVLECKLKKQFDNSLKKKHNSSKCKDKFDGSRVNVEADIQIHFTNQEGVSDKALSNSTEEARCTWDLGKSLGLSAQNENDVVNALVELHIEKEDGTKQAHARGKRGRKKRN